MAQTVKVRMRKPPRVFTFLSRDIPLERDEGCVVRSDRGLEYGVCVVPPEPCDQETEKRFKMLVVRRATPHDEKTHDKLLEDEIHAKKTCAKKIRERDIAMKLVEAEYSFDRRKIVFYFTAEDRVDFRELVRDLAQDLKTRIELRHIQVRDEAKMVGGIGTCGRELCCTTWMREFIPISMKMAKRQNLSLNPSKISGQCGRLMCCLSYENELYAQVRRGKGGKKPVAAPGDSRDTMEANAEQAAEVLKKTSLRDVAQEEAKSTPDSGAPAREDAKRPQGSKETSDHAKGPEAKQGQPGQTTTEGSDASKRPRRRRRRRGRGGGSKNKPSQGGGSSN